LGPYEKALGRFERFLATLAATATVVDSMMESNATANDILGVLKRSHRLDEDGALSCENA